LSTLQEFPRALLAQGLAELGEDPEQLEAALDRLAALAELVARWTRRIDLTGHGTPEEAVRRLILDALALARAAPPFESLADLGSGAGFPGLPIAIRYPDRRVTLIESRERRHHFQRAAARELGLANVDPLRGRAEELEPRPHAAVVAQALGAAGAVLGWMLRWARPGAHLLLPGGPAPPRPPAHPQVIDAEVVSYSVPLGGPKRTLWIGKRAAV
jgi:16S rRNA (guanine527-N7)-methyltransferase